MRVVIDANNVMADIGEARPGHKTNVTGTDNCKIHKRTSRRLNRNARGVMNSIGLTLFLDSNPPVIIDAIISADDKQAAVVEEGIVVQIAMPEVQLQIGHRLNTRDRIDFSKTLGKSRYLRVNRNRYPWQR